MSPLLRSIPLRRALLGALLLLPACASAGPGDLLGDDGSTADDPACLGAHDDRAGVCRLANGRYAPARCCQSADRSFADQCETFDDHAADVCLPDDDAAVDWPGCFAGSQVTDSFAAGCCEAAPARQYLWCDAVRICSDQVPSPVGDTIEAVAAAQVGTVHVTAGHTDQASATGSAQVLAAVQRLGLLGPDGTLADAASLSDDGIGVTDLELEGDHLAADWIDLRVAGKTLGVVFADGTTDAIAEIHDQAVIGCR